MKIETIVWMVFVLIGVALAGGFGALLVGVLWVGYALGIARMAIHVVWMVFVLIGAALAGWFGALLVGVLWVGYALGTARAAIHVARRERPPDG